MRKTTRETGSKRNLLMFLQILPHVDVLDFNIDTSCFENSGMPNTRKLKEFLNLKFRQDIKQVIKSSSFNLGYNLRILNKSTHFFIFLCYISCVCISKPTQKKKKTTRMEINHNETHIAPLAKYNAKRIKKSPSSVRSVRSPVKVNAEIK